MRNKPAVRLLALAAAAALALAGPQGPVRKKKAAPPAEPLVRTSLLGALGQVDAAVKRDPFRPGAEGIAASEEQPEAGAGDEATEPAAAGEKAPGAIGATPGDPSMSYVGVVRSSKKIIALVLVNGAPTAVAAGEAVLPGYTVRSVEPSRIEVEAPGGRVLVFSFQGDE